MSSTMPAAMNRFDVPLECRVPLGSTVLEIKYCEVCGCSFVRPLSPTHMEIRQERLEWDYRGPRVEVLRLIDTGERYCKKCRRQEVSVLISERILAQEKYKEQLPSEAQQRHSHHLPKYDKTLLPREPYNHVAPSLKRTGVYVGLTKAQISLEVDKWVALVKAAFRERGRLTTEQLCEIIPGCYTPVLAYHRCMSQSLKLKRVGDAPRRTSNGRPPGIYVLPGVSPETLEVAEVIQ